jgi:hypothetical protein
VPLTLAGKRPRQLVADLFWAPPLPEQSTDEITQHVVIDDLPSTGASPTLYCELVRDERTVLAVHGISVAL